MLKRRLALVFIILAFVRAAYAHPPSDIQLSYDRYAKMLKIKIDHPVTNPKTHFIGEIKVFINGGLAIDHKLKSQETEGSEFMQYTIPDAENGDAVRVEAYCNSFGKRFAEIKIER